MSPVYQKRITQVVTQTLQGWPKQIVFDPTTTTWVSNLLPVDLTKSGPIKDYKLKISKGEFAGSALQVSETSLRVISEVHAESHYWDLPNMGAFRNKIDRLNGMSLFLPGIADPGTPSATSSNTAALTRLSNKLANELTTFQGGIFVGELKQTIHGIRHPLQALRSGLTKHLELVAKRAKRIRKIKNMRDMVTGTWLEFAYGIGPTLSDVDDGVQALADFVVDPKSREFKTLTASGDHELAIDKTMQNIGLSFGPLNVRAQGVRKRVCTTKYLACIGVLPSVRSCAFGKLGINFANFVPTLWELVPYSFVVDYFTNLGNVITGISNLTADVWWVMRWDIETDTEEAHCFLGPVADPVSVEWRKCSGGHLIYEKRTINRAKHLGSLIPAFRWELPGSSSKKWLNLAALTTQLAVTRKIVKQPERAKINDKLFLLRKGTF